MVWRIEDERKTRFFFPSIRWTRLKMNFQDDEFAIAICSFVPNKRTGMLFFAHCTIVVEILRYMAGTPCHRCAKSAIDLISKARYDSPRSKILQGQKGCNKLVLRVIVWLIDEIRRLFLDL